LFAPYQRLSLRGLDGEFWPAEELIVVGLWRPKTGGFWISAKKIIASSNQKNKEVKKTPEISK
jgi:hypothetical protein